MDENNTSTSYGDVYISVTKTHGGYIIALSEGQRIETNLDVVLEVLRYALTTKITSVIPTV